MMAPRPLSRHGLHRWEQDPGQAPALVRRSLDRSIGGPSGRKRTRIPIQRQSAVGHGGDEVFMFLILDILGERHGMSVHVFRMRPRLGWA